MNKPIKNKNVLDFSPRCFRRPLAHWDNNELEIINSIKRTYSFTEDFDLHSYLYELSMDIKLFSEHKRETPTLTETKTLLNIVEKQLVKVQKSLAKKEKLLPVTTKNQLEKLAEILENSGPKGTFSIASNTKNDYKTLHSLIKSLTVLLSSDDFLNNFKTCLFHLIEIVNRSKNKLPKPNRGRKTDELAKRVIQNLLSIYTKGTDRRAVCYRSTSKAEYTGEFYYFLLEIISLINGKKYSITFMSPEEWHAPQNLSKKVLYVMQQENNLVYKLLVEGKEQSDAISLVELDLASDSPITDDLIKSVTKKIIQLAAIKGYIYVPIQRLKRQTWGNYAREIIQESHPHN